jgi:ABC-type transport system involved in multi-copper enzyme maturation permease subunit
MRDVWFIARKDVALLLRIRETLVWVFVMPVFFIYFIGAVTGGFGAPSADRRDVLAVRASNAGGLLEDELIRRLEGQFYDVRRPDTDKEWSTYSRRLTIPDPIAPYTTFTDAVLHGQPQALTLTVSGDSTNSIDAGYDQVRVSHAVYEVVGDLALVKMDNTPASADAFARVKALPRPLTLAVKSAGKRIAPPEGFSQAVPGTMVYFTMLVLLTSGAILLVVEREKGLLRRLASAPIPAGSIVLGKWIARMLLGLVQIGFAMAAGTLFFKMDWGPAWPMVLVVLLSWAAFVASLSIVLGSVVRSAAQMTGLGVLATMVFAALGGCWWPIEITPAWMQTFAHFIPTGWAMDAIHRIVNFGYGPSVAIPHVAALLVGALVLGWIGSRVFRYQ